VPAPDALALVRPRRTTYDRIGWPDQAAAPARPVGPAR
jgi:hypothetical protein